MASSGETAAQRNTTSAPTPSDPLSTNTGPNFRQNALQGGAQTTWNPAAHYMFIQWYYQYYYQMLNYYSQLHNWQTYMSSQSGSLTPTFSQSVAGPGLQPISGQNYTVPQINQQTAVLHARTQAQTDSCEARIATIPRRITAELIDFVFLYFTKFLTFSLFYNDMDQGNQLYYTLIIDEDTTLADLEGFVVQALTYRFLVLAYEVFFLIGGFHGSLGGATPGKYLMGLSVVSANQVHTLAVDQSGERVRVVPGRNLGLWRAFIRAMIKNFSMAFLFPACLTVFFFQHNRTIYDIIAGSAVVTSASGRRQQPQRH